MVSGLTALDKIKDCLLNGHDFVLQGGAGCGKTETLKQLIDFISTEHPDKKIACITHTNKAADEIKSRINSEHVVSTIHSFLNALIKDYKKNIHLVIYELFKVDSMERLDLANYLDEKEQKSKEHEKYKKVYEKYSARYFLVFGGRTDKVEGKKIYDTNPEDFNLVLNDKILILNNKIREEIQQKGFMSIEYNETRFNDFKDLTFGHDGLLDISALLIDKYPLLGKILNDKFDYIFIDEYQDTHKQIVNLFLTKLPERNKPVIGLFGDSMQSIYGDGICNVDDYVQAGSLKRIDKEDNYRCSPQVIKFINKLRNDGLNQELALKIKDGKVESFEERHGKVEFFYSFYDNKPNSWSTDAEKEAYTNGLNTLIEKSSFDVDSKILLLSNKAVSIIELLEHLALFAPDILRWAIRYSKLFTRVDSLTWNSLRQKVEGDEWRIFIGVCDRLLVQLEPFDQIIHSAENELAHLSLIETLSYLTVLAYEQLIPGAPTNSEANEWRVYSCSGPII